MPLTLWTPHVLNNQHLKPRKPLPSPPHKMIHRLPILPNALSSPHTPNIHPQYPPDYTDWLDNNSELLLRHDEHFHRRRMMRRAFQTLEDIDFSLTRHNPLNSEDACANGRLDEGLAHRHTYRW
jgi:hypothetical protein